MDATTAKPPLLGLVWAFILGAPGFAHGAESKVKAPACVYGEHTMEAPAQAPKRSRLLLTGTAPPADAAVHPNTVLGIDVEYHVQEFEAGRYELVVHFAELVPGSTKIAGDNASEPRMLSQAHGTAHLCVPIGALFREDDVRWPLRMHISLQKRTGPRSSLLYAQTQFVSFPSPDLSAKVQRRQKQSPPDDYFYALDSVFAFREEQVSLYKGCVERFPETAATLEAPYRAWSERHAALFEQMEALQLERYTEMTRGTDQNAANRLRAARDDFVEYVDNQSDVTLRRRCAELHLVFAGEPREFIGRYLAIVNDYVASRPAPKAAAK